MEDDHDEIADVLLAWLDVRGNDDVAQAAREGLVALAQEELARREERPDANRVRPDPKARTAAPRQVPTRPPPLPVQHPTRARAEVGAAARAAVTQAPSVPSSPVQSERVVAPAARTRELVGADLAAWRSRSRLTQVVAAGRLGVSQGTISKAESKPRALLGPTLRIALARVLQAAPARAPRPWEVNLATPPLDASRPVGSVPGATAKEDVAP